MKASNFLDKCNHVYEYDGAGGSEAYVNYSEAEEKMIEFAKMHVQAALKEAAKLGYKYGVNAHETEQTILNSYPLDNIK